MQEQELVGHWWLPGNPSQAYGGEMKFHPESGPEITLSGRYDGTNVGGEVGPLFGTVYNGMAVTITDCRYISNTDGDKFRGEVVFLGGHLKEGQDSTFERITVQFPHMNELMAWDAINSSQVSDEAGFNMQVSPPNDISFYANDAEFRIGVGHEMHMQVYRGASANQHVDTSIEPNTKSTFRQFKQEYLLVLGRFVSFGTAQSLNPTKVTARLKSNNKVDVLYSVNRASKESDDVLHPYKMNFSRENMNESFGDILSRWFELHNHIKPAFDIYFGTLRLDDLYPSYKVISLTRAVEAYHRRQFRKDEDVNEMESASSTDGNRKEKDIKSIGERQESHNGHQYLYRCFKEIFEIHSNIFESLGLSDEYIDIIVDTRNYLLHSYQEHSKPQNASSDPHEFVRISYILQLLLDVCWLSDIGFSEEYIVDQLSHRVRRLQLFGN